MTQPTVVLLGDLSIEMAAVSGSVREFGWSMEAAASLDQLRQLGRARSIVAVILDAKGLGLTLEQALRAAQKAAPNARLIACHRFSDRVDWPELAEAGAFHALAVPLDRDEVRQSLGFVWSARLRRSANVVSMPNPESAQDVAQLRDAS
jgi:DNA-binding NtrC family response regulator